MSKPRFTLPRDQLGESEVAFREQSAVSNLAMCWYDCWYLAPSILNFYRLMSIVRVE